MASGYESLSEATLAELDALLAGARQWDSFYEDRAKPCPFFRNFPDHCLAEWIERGQVPRGRALELGCGNGRNAVFLARHSFFVDGVDYSQAAIDWASERVAEAGVDVHLIRASVFDADLAPGSYDLVYDSGCFHHVPPHRRHTYVSLVTGALRPGGFFGLTCFRPEAGSGCSDDEVYQRRSLGGGLGYSEQRLREIWSCGLQIRSLRRMDKQGPETGLFGEPFLWTLLAQKP